MRSLINMRRFHEPLRAAGLVPDNCRGMHLAIGVDGAMSMTYDVFLTAEQLIAMGTVLRNVGEAIVTEDLNRSSKPKGEPNAK